VIGIILVFALVALFGVLPAFLPIGDGRIYGPGSDRDAR
jgi:hypothetical protein